MPTVKISESTENNDYVLPLPPEIIEGMGWKKGDLLSVTKCATAIHLTKVQEDL